MILEKKNQKKKNRRKIVDFSDKNRFFSDKNRYFLEISDFFLDSKNMKKKNASEGF